MKINEVIVSKKHLFDVLSSQVVVSFNRRYDKLAAISSEFTLPVSYFNQHLLEEYISDVNAELAEMQIRLPPDSEWIVKATTLLNYLRGK